nr:extensin-like [Lolium perenne]
MVQAWSMPWSAPSPLGAPPAYTGTLAPGLRPHTGAPGLLAPRAPPNAYYAAPAYHDGGMSYMQYQHPPLYQPPPVLMAPPPTAPLRPSTPTAAPSPSWDQSAFLQAMNNFAALGNSGLPDQSGDRAVQ